MRKSTNKTERLRSIIFQLIGENEYILEAIKSICACGGNKPNIGIATQKGSSCDYKTHHIGLSLPDIIGAYDKIHRLKSIPTCNFVLDKSFGDYNSNKSIRQYVEIPSRSCSAEQEITKLLEGTNFINEDILTSMEIYAIYSMAYSLYHEIGHLIYDKYIPDIEQIRREQVADMFAFRAIKSFEIKGNEKTLILGTLIGVTFIFERTTPQIEKDDKEHPYTVDRITTLLNYWGVPDESLFWELAYKEFKNWCINTSVDWENKTNCSGKEKFTNVSLQFKEWAIQ